VLGSGTQDRGFAPDLSSRIFPAGKIHSMPSFGRGSKIICPMLVTRTTKRSKTVKTDKKGLLWYKKNIPVGARFFAHVQTGPGAHPASCSMGTGYFLGVQRPGRGADHPPPPSAEVENEHSYTSTPPVGPSWPVIGRSLPLPLPHLIRVPSQNNFTWHIS
jgi:hypothetical protein